MSTAQHQQLLAEESDEIVTSAASNEEEDEECEEIVTNVTSKDAEGIEKDREAEGEDQDADRDKDESQEEEADAEPFYVNPKQFNRIVKRRIARVELEKHFERTTSVRKRKAALEDIVRSRKVAEIDGWRKRIPLKMDDAEDNASAKNP